LKLHWRDFISFHFYSEYLFSNLKYAENFNHKIKIIFCRLRGHPNGVVWYSNGMEPDMSCKDCGDEL